MDKLISTCCEGTVERNMRKDSLIWNNPRPSRPFTRAINKSPQTEDGFLI